MPIQVDETVLRTSFDTKQEALYFLKSLGFGGYETFEYEGRWHFRLTPIGRQRLEQEQGRKR